MAGTVTGSGSEVVDDASIVAGADARRTGGRLEFLDALRGIAALMVVIQHVGEQVSSRYRVWTTVWLHPGEIGVIVFFLCSGFIIPASIERYGSVARFWIGRFFRLYPMYWAAMAAAFVLDWRFHRYSVGHPTNGRLHLVFTNATMVERMLRSPMWTGAAWTLAYELVFYLLVTVLFIAGVYRQSVRIAVVGFAITAATAAFRVSAYTSIGKQGHHGIALMVVVFLVALATVALVGRLDLPRTFAVAGLLALIVPLTANRADALWLALLLFSTMFTGTVLYRACHGDLPWRTAGYVGAGLFVLAAFTWRRAIVPYADVETGRFITWYGETLTYWVAYAIFGFGLLLREKAFPWVARELGRSSYSLYLVHAIVIHSIHLHHGEGAKAAVAIAASVVLSMVTYRVIEQPAIKLGRRASARLSGRRVPAPSA
jgi:peptidoglycan/LPS O-acetylase OafA/YrhL